MKTTQYIRQLKAIEAADANVIHEWWMFGLRLLRDPESMAPSGVSLRHGVADQLVAAAGKDSKGRPRLSAQKIQRALQCARAYPTEAQIRHAVTDFESWRDLVAAGFPTYAAEDGEPPADHRDARERARDAARQLARLADDEAQSALFPLDRYEPAQTQLKDLREYMTQQEEITARFVEHGQKRRAYFHRLEVAAGGDLSMTWLAAHDRLGEEEPDRAEIGAAA